MDNFELNLLEAIAEDARVTPAALAKMTGHTIVEVQNTLDRLEKEKVILGYPAMINWESVDKETVDAIIEVKVSPQRGEGFDAIAEQIYRFEEVTSVYLMSGSYDLLVMLHGKSLKQLSLFVSEKLSTLEHVLSTATHFVLKRYKDNGIVVEGRHVDDRLVVSP